MFTLLSLGIIQGLPLALGMILVLMVYHSRQWEWSKAVNTATAGGCGLLLMTCILVMGYLMTLGG